MLEQHIKHVLKCLYSVGIQFDKWFRLKLKVIVNCLKSCKLFTEES